jgi:hypothetical protein
MRPTLLTAAIMLVLTSFCIADAKEWRGISLQVSRDCVSFMKSLYSRVVGHVTNL